MRILLIICGFIVWTSCITNNENNGPKRVESEAITPQKEPLYPYVQFIREQLAYIDTTPFPILRITYVNGIKTDSGYINKAAFKELAIPFTAYDVNETKLRPYYKEQSFNDLSLNTIAFSISTRAQLPLRQADILLNAETGKVKSIFLRQLITSPESEETRNLLWLNNQSFQISSSVQGKSGKTERVIKVIWNDPVS